MTDIKLITLIDAKEKRIDLRGVKLIGISAKTFEDACAQLAKGHPNLKVDVCYQYGGVYYFPCEVKHDATLQG